MIDVQRRVWICLDFEDDDTRGWENEDDRNNF